FAFCTDALAQEDGAPPVQGEALFSLLGQRAESEPVVALCTWAEVPLPDWQTERVMGKGIELTFSNSRVSQIYLELDPPPKVRWKWELPMGLDGSTRMDSLDESIWSGRYSSTGELSQYRNRYAELTQDVNGHIYKGYKVSLRFSSAGPLRDMILRNSPWTMWEQNCKIIQESVPVTQFTADGWLGFLGSDLAGPTGAFLAAWVGMPVNETYHERAGLRIVLTDHRWLDSIAFDPTFEGAFPFGLTAKFTEQDLMDLFGGAIVSAEDPAILEWTYTTPRYWPLHFDLDARFPAKPRFVLRAVREEVTAFYNLIHAEGAPSEALVAELVQLWDTARTNSESFKGRLEVTQGLLGTNNTWHTPQLLGGAIGGTVTEIETALANYRKIQFLLRSYDGDKEKAAQQLDAFAQALKGKLATTGDVQRTESGNKSSAALTWAPSGHDPFTLPPEFKIEAQTSAGGSELMLSMRVPMH
ncbi:MAG: hypothetical protein KDB61_05245, partial [Planctomycetes bacterium]|nr:hypothetical protein [Planctomycetota bacterium]